MHDDKVTWGTALTIINEVPFQTYNGIPVTPDVVTFNFIPPQVQPIEAEESSASITYTWTNGASPPDPEYMISEYSVPLTSILPGYPVAGQVGFTTAAPNLVTVGSVVTISGASPSQYNGTFTVVRAQTGNGFSVANTETATPTLGSATATVVGVFQMTINTLEYSPGVLIYWVSGAPGVSGLDLTKTQVVSKRKSVLIDF